MVPNDTQKIIVDNASFRDPSGYVVHHNNSIYRIINKNYANIFEKATESGLFKKLIDDEMLVNFEDNSELELNDSDIFKIIKQEKIKFISFPYEWSFDMLKDAALMTLEIQKKCIEFGFSLKDASAYNIQFHNGKPILIDITSFEEYSEEPWIAYRQFCEHFLGPLALMAKKDVRLSKLLVNYIDGIPLDIVSGIIPKSTFTNFGLSAHLHAHAKAQKRYEEKKVEKKKLKKIQLLGIIESLRSTIKNLNLEQKTEWAEYYKDTNYSEEGQLEKENIVREFIQKTSSDIIIDFGANDGKFSRIASEKTFVVSIDVDPIAVNKNYNHHDENIISIIGDLANPSQGIGWNNLERPSLLKRIEKNTCLALALIHHLRITFGIPLKKQFELFSSVAKYLIIEFVDKEDSQIQRLLQNREDVFDDYTEENFEMIISKYFEMIDSIKIKNSHRKIYLLKNKTEEFVSKD